MRSRVRGRIAIAWRTSGFFRATLSLSATVGLGACSGGTATGSGVGPVELSLSAASGTTTTPQGVARVFQCLGGGAHAQLYFSDGSSGDFTSRVTWTSENPSVVLVSNGDIASPTGGLYARGVLVPVSPGTATVTADYQTLHSQLQVSVGLPSAFSIERIDQSIPTPVSAVTLGVGTTQSFTVTAVLDDVLKDVSAYASWTAGNVGTASVTSSGVVTALGAGGTVPLTASFPSCTQTVSADLSVASIQGIEIQPEFGSDPLLSGNTERIDVLANLDGGAQQDVSLQAKLTSTNTAVANFLPAIGETNILQPVSAGTVTLQATLNNAYTAADRTIGITSSTLASMAVAPASAVVRSASVQRAYFTASGTYANGQVQDITRAVTWSVADTAVANISNAKTIAGVAEPVGSATGQTTVTATAPTGETATAATATLTVDSADNPVAP